MGMRSEISVSQNTHYEVYVPWQFMEHDFKSILQNLGVVQIDTLDLFDPRADIRHDMNLAVPEALKNRYASAIDIGSLEHVFDTRQCLKNLIDKIVFTAYSLEPEGFRIEKPIRGQDVILWCVAQKMGERREFTIPQQLACIDMYGTEFASGPRCNAGQMIRTLPGPICGRLNRAKGISKDISWSLASGGDNMKKAECYLSVSALSPPAAIWGSRLSVFARARR